MARAKKASFVLTEKGYPVHISMGNMKLGAIPNFSTPPGKTCSPEACKTCFRQGCYAVKAYRRKNVKKAWDDNERAAREDLSGLEKVLTAFFQKPTAPRFFRVHVSGDFFSRAYAEMWSRVAASAPKTNFLAFTKYWDNVRGVEFPENFSLILSGWPGCAIPADLRADHFAADCVEKGQTPPEGAKECKGDCSECAFCWSPDRDCYFHKH